MNDNEYLVNVRDQYESYPYPYRNVEDETTRLIEIGIERLELINFYCFRGECDFSNFRVLVAGGGTGDSTIYLAEQLRNYNAEVWYVDISQASMSIAKQRAKKRNLTNIRWHHCSILSLEDTFGSFDYISCTGVLHHLSDPLLGLQKLRKLLKSGGAMGLMLYGHYGRTGVYQMQTLLKMINKKENSLKSKIINTRKILSVLPETNWFMHNQKFLTDHTNEEDNGLVDLLLHEQDCAFNITEVYDLLDSSELNLIEFSDVGMRLSYRPEQHINDKELLNSIKSQSNREQFAISELIVGAFKKHEFYAATTTDTVAQFTKLSNIPFFFPVKQYKNLGGQLAEAISINFNKMISMKHHTGFEFDIGCSKLNYLLFKNINGINTLETIFQLIRTELDDESWTQERLLAHFLPIFQKFRQLDWLLLRGK